MDLLATKLNDCYVIEPNCFGDHRGWFMETYNQKAFEEKGLNYNFVQDNQSYSKQIGTVRGLHFQTDPMAQAKLVRCTRGRLFDVAVDLRETSPTYKQWFGIELTAENKKQLLIPRGFAHGFMALTNDVEIQYKADNFYSKENDGGIAWNDPEINVEWPMEVEPVLSDKDKNLKVLSLTEVKFK